MAVLPARFTDKVRSGRHTNMKSVFCFCEQYFARFHLFRELRNWGSRPLNGWRVARSLSQF